MTIRNFVSALLGVVAIGATAFGAAQLLGSPDEREPASVTLGTTGTAGTTTAGDISGPCDEPDNRNDPRCTGVITPPATTGREPGEDIRGPCDEPENRNDPRCTGAAPEDDRSGPGDGDDGDDRDDDRSGPGDGDDDDDDDRDDRSGPNRGPG
jgi:hypothetical protein